MKKSVNQAGRFMIMALLVIAALLVLIPFLWMFMSSFKDNKELYLAPWELPTIWRVENFKLAWEAGINKYLFNSIFVTVVSTLSSVFVSAMTAYPLSRLDFKGKKVIFLFVISGMMLAPQVALIPLYKLLQAMRIYNTYFAMILPYIAYRIPFTTFLLWGYMLSIPNEVEESARIDGCSYYKMFYKIIIPMSKPMIFTSVLLAARFIWNEVMFALVFTEDTELNTIPLGLMALKSDSGSNYPVLIAGLALTTIPMIILFLCIQKQFVRGLTAGSVKG